MDKQHLLERLIRQHKSERTVRNVVNDVGLIHGNNIKWFRWDGRKNAWLKIDTPDHPSTTVVLPDKGETDERITVTNGDNITDRTGI